MVNKPYSPACDRNRDPILSIIQPLFAERRSVLEIGSGTGQHAAYFAARMPHLTWHTSDLQDSHADIRCWLDQSGCANLRPPLVLDVTRESWPQVEVDAVFSANTAHIMSWDAVRGMMAGVGRLLPARGLFILYGPFNYGNAYTSDSNEQFDAWLKSRDPRSGIRNFEDIQRLALDAGLDLMQDCAMPANNRILHWRKTED